MWAWAVAFACALGMAVSCHNYAVFVWPAFMFAELLVLVCERRWRTRAWVAMAMGVIPFVWCWPLLSTFRAAAGQHWWSASRWSIVLTAPQVLFKWTGGMLGPAVTLALISVLLLWIVRALPMRALPASVRMPAGPFTPGECGLACGLLALPALEVVATLLAGEGMRERYAMPTIIGAALAVGALTSMVAPVFRLIVLSAMLVNYGIMARPVFATWSQGALLGSRMELERTCETVIAGHAREGLPVVVSSGQFYLQLARYASPPTRSLMRAVLDPRLAIEFSAESSDVIDRSVLAMQRYVPVHAVGYDEFVAANESFILITNGDSSEWLPAKLLHDGHALTILPPSGVGRAYKVSLKKP